MKAFEPLTHRNAASIFGSLTLLVVEVSGHGDHSSGAGLAQGLFSNALELHQDHGGHLFRGQLPRDSQPRHLNLGASVASIHHSEREGLSVIADDLTVISFNAASFGWRLAKKQQGYTRYYSCVFKNMLHGV